MTSATATSVPPLSRPDTLELFRRHMSARRAEFYESRSWMFQGERSGAKSTDLDGITRVNCRASGGVFNLGHANPRIRKVLVQALEAGLDIGDHMAASPWRAACAGALAAALPATVQRIAFCVGGGEAIDLALKMARATTGRVRIVTMTGAYHGVTGLALAASDGPVRRPEFGPYPAEFVRIAFGDEEAAAGAIDEDTAAVIVEPVQSSGGMRFASSAYFASLHALCRETGALLIVDEVQTGLGRMGVPFGCDYYGVQPDLLVTAKGLSGGLYPMAAVAYSDQCERAFDIEPFFHISTMGGSELGCAVTLEVLAILREPEFLANVAARGEQLWSGLQRIAGASTLGLSIRGAGLIGGIVAPSEELAAQLVRALAGAGVISSLTDDRKVLQMMPALIVDEPTIEEILDGFARACNALRSPAFQAEREEL